MNPTAAVIVAGGSGRRLGDDGPPKQFRTILGVPILEWALSAFVAHPAIGIIVVVLPQRYVDEPPEWLSSYPVTLVPGGERRSDSVRAGLAVIGPDVGRVMVHDGARPFPSAALIDRLLARNGAAIPGIEVPDTIKEVTADGMVVRTLDRGRLRGVQTPQLFPLDTLRVAHERALAEGLSTSDDAALLEWMGHPVEVVEGDVANIKVTRAVDLQLAEVLARGLPFPRRFAAAAGGADRRGPMRDR